MPFPVTRSTALSIGSPLASGKLQSLYGETMLFADFRGTGGNDRLLGSEQDDVLFGYNGNDVLIGGGGDDILRGGGGGGADVLRGGNGDDTLYGGDGNDRLIGGRGLDVMTGGAGADLFVFTELAYDWDRYDTISDFSGTQGDRIDLSAIDAVIGGADDPFAFLGTQEFTGVAGQVRVHYNANQDTTFILFDMDGDRTHDFAVGLNGQVDLTANDFVL